jgi:hypothetical protein
MPKRLERELFAVAKRRRYGKRRSNAYVYGTLRRLGWRPKPHRRK